METRKKPNFKKWMSLLVLCCGTGVIFQLPYIRNTFYVPLVEALNLTNEEFGLLDFYTNEFSKCHDRVSSIETFIVYKGFSLKVPYIL